MHHYKDWVPCFLKGMKQELAMQLHLQVGPCNPASIDTELQLSKIGIIITKVGIDRKT